MLINNHTNIDNDIIAIEAVVPQINHLRNSLYDIHSIEDYKQLRGELSQMLFDIETEIRKAVDNMKVIQHNNRQFYDSYAELENNFDEFNARTKQMSAENAHLISKLEDANKHIEYLTHITMNQESYINELIEKLSTREKDVYGCQVTKKKDFFMNSNNNNNNNVNSSRLSGDGTMLLNTNKILNFNYDSNSFQDNLNESNNNNNNNNNKGGCSSSGNNCNGNELPITKVMVPDKENNDVDFIYSREQLSDPITLPILNVNIHSHNTSITDPKVNINVLESENKNYRISEIEIIYNCNPKLSGFVLITMSIKAIFCKEISLTWEKHCNGNQLTHMPKINLGFSRGVHNIINHGILLSFHRNMIDKTYATKDSNHFLVTGNMLHLFISSGEIKKNLNVSTMTVSSPNSHINTNHNFNSSYISSTLVGDISKGGILEPNEDKEFYVFFECKDKEAKLDYGTDMQLDIPFDDNKIISLYFTKVCKVYKPLFIIRIIKFLYWCALMSVVGFILVIVYFLYN